MNLIKKRLIRAAEKPSQEKMKEIVLLAAKNIFCNMKGFNLEKIGIDTFLDFGSAADEASRKDTIEYLKKFKNNEEFKYSTAFSNTLEDAVKHYAKDLYDVFAGTYGGYGEALEEECEKLEKQYNVDVIEAFDEINLSENEFVEYLVSNCYSVFAPKLIDLAIKYGN